MTDLDAIRSALGQSYAAIENLCAGMSPAQWRAQSLCPDWTVRAVVGHLAGIEQTLPSRRGLPRCSVSAARTWPRSARTTWPGRPP